MASIKMSAIGALTVATLIGSAEATPWVGVTGAQPVHWSPVG